MIEEIEITPREWMVLLHYNEVVIHKPGNKHFHLKCKFMMERPKEKESDKTNERTTKTKPQQEQQKHKSKNQRTNRQQMPEV